MPGRMVHVATCLFAGVLLVLTAFVYFGFCQHADGIPTPQKTVSNFVMRPSADPRTCVLLVRNEARRRAILHPRLGEVQLTYALTGNGLGTIEVPGGGTALNRVQARAPAHAKHQQFLDVKVVWRDAATRVGVCDLVLWMEDDYTECPASEHRWHAVREFVVQHASPLAVVHVAQGFSGLLMRREAFVHWTHVLDAQTFQRGSAIDVMLLDAMVGHIYVYRFILLQHTVGASTLESTDDDATRQRFMLECGQVNTASMIHDADAFDIFNCRDALFSPCPAGTPTMDNVTTATQDAPPYALVIGDPGASCDSVCDPQSCVQGAFATINTLEHPEILGTCAARKMSCFAGSEIPAMHGDICYGTPWPERTTCAARYAGMTRFCPCSIVSVRNDTL